jgi:hypothetical protein
MQLLGDRTNSPSEEILPPARHRLSNLDDEEELRGRMSERSLRNGANHGLMVPTKALPGASGSLALERMRKRWQRRQLAVYCRRRECTMEIPVRCGGNMNLRQREDRIFERYRALGESIIPDGALGAEYQTAHRRILVILKEPHDTEGGFARSGGDIRDFGVKHNRTATWNNLARWSALANNPRLTMTEIDVSDLTKRREHLRRISVVNLKKAGGCATAVMSEIKGYAEQHWNLLKQQFGLYKPHATIAGGTFEILAELRGSTVIPREGERFPFFEDQDLGICIDFYHPQQRGFTNQRLFEYLRQQLICHRLAD